MKELKRVLVLYIINAVIFGLCGLIWTYQGFFKNPQVDINSVMMGAICLGATVLWIFRAVRTAKRMQQ